VASATDETTLRDALGHARLQDCPAQRPPAFFVQRPLDLRTVGTDDRVRLLHEIFPTVNDPGAMKMLALVDAGAFTQREDVACLNRYFYADVVQLLDSSAAHGRGLLDQHALLGRW